MSVYKKLLILLFSSFVGIVANPELPFASDTVAVTDITGAVETVEVQSISNEDNNSLVVNYSYEPSNIASPYVEPSLAYDEPVAPVSVKPVVTIPQNSINIFGRSIELINVSSTAIDAGNHANKYGSKFIYGHNSSSVFGVLYNMGVGSAFSVTENGVTTNYAVDAVVIYEKIDGYTLRLDGNDIKMSVVAKGRYNGKNYDLSLMTCYGTSYGNGDASHRLVLFASKI